MDYNLLVSFILLLEMSSFWPWEPLQIVLPFSQCSVSQRDDLGLSSAASPHPPFLISSVSSRHCLPFWGSVTSGERKKGRKTQIAS